MRTPHRFRTIASVAAVAVLAAITLNPTTVGAQDTDAAERGCAREFDAAVAQYVRTTDERDADGFNALLHKEVTVIFRQGEVLDRPTEPRGTVTAPSHNPPDIRIVRWDVTTLGNFGEAD